VIPHILPPFVRKYPKVKLHLQEMTISQQITARKEYRIGAGILRGPINEPELEAVTLFEVKSPKESKYAWDYFKKVGTLPGSEAYRSLADGKCSFIAKNTD
jgi:hypothetical protein